MSSSDGSRLGSGIEWIEQSKKLGSLGQTFVTALGGLVAFIFGGAIAIGDAGVGLVVGLLDVAGLGGQEWLRAFLVDPAQFIGASFESAAVSLRTGAWAELGPFLPWVAVIVGLGVIWMVTTYLDRQDSDVPGLGIDLPFLGNEAEEEGLDLPILGNDDEGEGE